MAGQLAYRQELFFKSQAELTTKVLPLLRVHPAACSVGVNLTNKTKDDQLLDAVRALKAELPELDICVHWSCKWNWQRNVEASFQVLLELAQELSTIEGTSLLLVSGGGKRKPLDSLKALELAAEKRTQFRQLGVPLFVAYNPYLPDAEQQAEERRRLRAKLLGSGGLVAGVYLQMGTDLQKLESGLQYLEGLTAEAAMAEAKDPGMRRGSSAGDGERQQLQLLGSVFVPSKRLLAQMRFRPWNGVFLSEEYLGSVEKAEAITQQLLQVYGRHNVTPLVETAVRNEAELQQVEAMLRAGLGASSAGG